jgi:hypothetical protein
VTKLELFRSTFSEVKRDLWWGGMAPSRAFGTAVHLFAEAFEEHVTKTIERLLKLESEVKALKTELANLKRLETDGK